MRMMLLIRTSRLKMSEMMKMLRKIGGVKSQKSNVKKMKIVINYEVDLSRIK